MSDMNSTKTVGKTYKRCATSAFGIAGLAVAAAMSVPATAGAQAATSAGSVSGSAEILPRLAPADDRLVATGGSPTGTCAGTVSTTISPQSFPGASSVSWAFGILGVGSCDLTATLSWRNLDTGATGEKIAHIPAPRISGGVPDPIVHPYDAVISTGAGQVEYTLTTNGGAEAGPIIVQTPEYED